MKNINISTGIRFGIGIGILYVILLYCRWSKASSPSLVGIIGVVTYVFIIGSLFYESYFRRKQTGGLILMKDLFQTLFISVLIFELLYSIYNFIHFKYIDTTVVEKMKKGALEMYQQMDKAIPEADKQSALNSFDSLKDNYTQTGLIIQAYLRSIAVSGALAALVAFIMKKNSPATQQ